MGSLIRLDPARLAGWPAALLALVSGALLVLAFAPFGLWPLAIIAPALLFRLLQGRPPVVGFALGYLFGLGLLGFGVSWLQVSIGQFGGITPPLALLLTAVFILFVALYFGLLGYLVARLSRGQPAGVSGLIFAAVWLLLEWLRGWLFSGFPWLNLGAAMVDSPLVHYVPAIGVYGVSLLVVWQAVLLSSLYRVWAWLLLALIWGGGLLLGQADWVAPRGEPFRVSLVQGNIEQKLKWRPEQFRPTLARYLGLTGEAGDSRLIVWPETAVPAFAEQVEESLLQPLHEQLAARGQDLVLGIPVSDGDGYTNSMLSLGVSGRGRYDKRHLVPFGEFLPFKTWLSPLVRWLKIPMSDFKDGSDKPPLLTLAGLPAGMSICYEDAFGAEVAQALPAAAFLVNASNDAWFGDSLAPHQHLQIARMRALEGGRFLLRATNTGISAIIDQHGEPVAVSPQFEAAVLSAEIQPLQGETPYLLWGNWLAVITALFLLALGLLLRRD